MEELIDNNIVHSDIDNNILNTESQNPNLEDINKKNEPPSERFWLSPYTFWKWKYLIISIIIVGVVFSYFYSYTSPNIYRAYVVLSPYGDIYFHQIVTDQNTEFNELEGPAGSAGESLSNMATSLDPTKDSDQDSSLMFKKSDLQSITKKQYMLVALNYDYTTYASIYVQSKSAKRKLIIDYNLMPRLFSDLWDKNKQAWRITQDDRYFDYINKIIKYLITLINSTYYSKSNDISGIPSIEQGVDILDKAIVITLPITTKFIVDKETQESIESKSLTIYVEDKDPLLALDILKYLIFEMNDYLYKEIKTFAIKIPQVQYSEDPSMMVKSTIPDILFDISNPENQERFHFISEEKDYVFNIIDPPRFVGSPNSPNRSRVKKLGLIISVILGFSIALIIEFLSSQFKAYKKYGHIKRPKKKRKSTKKKIKSKRIYSPSNSVRENIL